MNQNKVNRSNYTPGNGRRLISHYVGIFFYVVQLLLVFRFAFKLLGANASNRFVSLLYSATAPLTNLFEGIFPEVVLENYDMLHVFEPSSVIALVVTAIIAGLIRRLLLPHETTPAVQTKNTDIIETQPPHMEKKKTE